MDPQALEKLLIEMDNQLNKTRAELTMCELQLERVDTNLNVISSTSKSLHRICGPHESVWQGIGRCFVETNVDVYLEQLSKDEAGFQDTKKSLLTKKNYLDTTLDKTVLHMQKLVKGDD